MLLLILRGGFPLVLLPEPVYCSILRIVLLLFCHVMENAKATNMMAIHISSDGSIQPLFWGNPPPNCGTPNVRSAADTNIGHEGITQKEDIPTRLK